MKYLGLMLMGYLLCGVHGNFFDDLKSAASSVGNALSHYGGQALQSALDTLTTDGVKNLVSAGVSAATTAALGALLGRRDASEVSQAVEILKQDAAMLEKILHGYSADLQTAYNHIESLDFLKKDPKKFIADIGVLKSRYDAVLDSLVQKFQAKLSQLHGHQHKRGLLDDLGAAFQHTVDTFKQTFGGVAGSLQGQGGSLLDNVVQHLGSAAQNLGTSLSGLKETAAKLLAQGQEHLQTLQTQTGQTVDQTNGGVLGAAHQVVDTLLHPQSY